LWPVGAEFWVFPTLLDDTKPWWEALTPFYSLERAPMDEATLIGRGLVFALGALIGAEYQRNGSPIVDLMENVLSPFQDTLDWGVLKLEGPVMGSGNAQKLALDSLKAEFEKDAAAEQKDIINGVPNNNLNADRAAMGLDSKAKRDARPTSRSASESATATSSDSPDSHFNELDEMDSDDEADASEDRDLEELDD